MKHSLTLILLLNCMIAPCQSKTSTVELRKGIVVTAVIEKFVKQKHKIDTCTDSFKNKYICKIDNGIWFGSDQGLELHKNQLISLKIKIFNNYVPLKVSKMFN